MNTTISKISMIFHANLNKIDPLGMSFAEMLFDSHMEILKKFPNISGKFSYSPSIEAIHYEFNGDYKECCNFNTYITKSIIRYKTKNDKTKSRRFTKIGCDCQRTQATKSGFEIRTVIIHGSR